MSASSFGAIARSSGGMAKGPQALPNFALVNWSARSCVPTRALESRGIILRSGNEEAYLAREVFHQRCVALMAAVHHGSEMPLDVDSLTTSALRVLAVLISDGVPRSVDSFLKVLDLIVPP